MAWIAGTLEVASKVRYGLTTRGCPIFRFVPYDKRYAPFAVGSSIRDFSTNVHVIIEPSEGGKTSMPKGSIVQLLGAPCAYACACVRVSVAGEGTEAMSPEVKQ